MKKHLSLFTISIAIVAIVVVLVGGQFAVRVHAQTSSASMNGWTWSSNIGWGSASSTQPGAGVSGPYGLQVDGSGNINGYVWTSNIGWIKFGNGGGDAYGALSGFPVASGNANVNLTTGAVTGWARACGGTASGNCSSMTSRTDGWDGWIELSGANHATETGLSGTNVSSHGVSFNPVSGAFSGYAWGSDVVGWIDFSGITLGNNNNNNGADFTVTGSTVNLTTAAPTAPASVTIAETNGLNQTINLSFAGMYSSNDYSPNDLMVAITSSSICILSSSHPSCVIPVSVTLRNTTNAQTSYSIPAIGTRTSPTNPPEVETGTILVNVTGPNCHTGCCGSGCVGLTVTCLYTPPTSLPASMTVSLTSNGVAPVTYKWADNNSTNSSRIFSFNSSSQNPYPLPGVSVVDANGNTGSISSCGSVNLTGNNQTVTVPELWPNTSKPAILDSTAASNPSAVKNILLATTARPGSNVKINYALPNSAVTCYGIQDSGPSLNEWTGGANQSSYDSVSGSVTLHNLVQGVYKIHLGRCIDTSLITQAHNNSFMAALENLFATNNGSIQNSNTVEIDVAPSTIQEK
jgi:hypothetical protein